MRDDEDCLAEPMMADCDWRELIRAAESAGRWAARETARRCSTWDLGRAGRVWVRVEPLVSPVATWLCRHGYGEASGTGVDVAIATTAADLDRVADAERKARSILVRRAYASAYSTVLAEEAGVAARLVTVPGVSAPFETPRSEYRRSESDSSESGESGSGEPAEPIVPA